MDLKEIQRRVKEIEENRWNDETAHSLEDTLHIAFIQHCATYGNDELSAMASEILKTGKIDFARWCA